MSKSQGLTREFNYGWVVVGAGTGGIGPRAVTDRDIEGACGLDARVGQRGGGEVALDALEQPRVFRHTGTLAALDDGKGPAPASGAPVPLPRVTRARDGSRWNGTMVS